MNVVVADDHALFRAGMIELLEALYGKDLKVVETNSYQETLEILARDSADLVLCDLIMPDLGTGGDLTKVVSAAAPAPVLVVSSSDQPLTAHNALRLGAKGYVCKSQSAASLSAAITLVLAGDTYLPTKFVMNGKTHAHEDQTVAQGDYEEEAPNEGILTPRQHQMMSFLRDGLSNKEIARRLNLSDATVKAHLRAVFLKLGVRNRTQAALLASRWKTKASPLSPTVDRDYSRPVEQEPAASRRSGERSKH